LSASQLFGKKKKKEKKNEEKEKEKEQERGRGISNPYERQNLRR
jgi:hypothetical protein